MNCYEEGCDAVKHLCFECYQQHEEISEEEVDKMHVENPPLEAREEMIQAMVQSIEEEIFPQIWEGEKEGLKELSKKEIAKFMFSKGAEVMAEEIIGDVKKLPKEDDSREENEKVSEEEKENEVLAGHDEK